MTINLLSMAIYTKLCGILPYLIYLLSMTMTIYETSNCVQRCRYTYRRPCRTEYNPDYYSRDQIKCRMAEYNADYNTEYNTKFVTKIHYREYYPGSNSATTSYSTTMTFDDYKSPSESTPN